jgi:glycosyltransferase involved in cell wall biosynthesis
MIQPYPDGITTRRTSAMAALSHGRPVVTNQGVLTEPIWSSSSAVAIVPEHDLRAFAESVSGLLNNNLERAQLGLKAKELYLECFDLSRTIGEMRA